MEVKAEILDFIDCCFTHTLTALSERNSASTSPKLLNALLAHICFARRGHI